ncbi:hypothetical protein CC79DRAFT_1331835 [Sarocladium strictum]
MGTNNPVPSRAAIHALRGLVFGTSCSVVLVAEERRRRLKTVRTAAENARKIHAAKTHRGVASGDSHLTWATRLLQRDDEPLASTGDSPSPRNFRRTKPEKKKRVRGRDRALNSAGTAGTFANTVAQDFQIDSAGSTIITASEKKQNAPSLRNTAPSSGDGLSAWLNRLDGVDTATLASVKDEDRPSIISSSPKLEPIGLSTHHRHSLTSAIRRKMAANEIIPAMVESSHETASQAPDSPATHSAAQDQMPTPERTALDPQKQYEMSEGFIPEHLRAASAGEAALLEQSESQETETLRSQRTVDLEALADAGDALAKWELRVRGPIPRSRDVAENNTHASKDGETDPLPTRRRYATQLQDIPARWTSVSPWPLVEAGDGLAQWEVQLRDTTDQTQLSRTPKVLFSQRFFALDSEGHCRPTFELPTIGTTAAKFCRQVKRNWAARDHSLTWLNSYLMLEQLLYANQANNKINLSARISSVIGILHRSRVTAPETLRYRPSEIALAFLQDITKTNVRDLTRHFQLLLPKGLDVFEILPKFARWTVRDGHFDALRQVLQLSRKHISSSVWQDGKFLTSLLQLSIDSSITARDLLSALEQADVTLVPESVLTQLRTAMIDPDAIVTADPVALSVLQQAEGDGTLCTSAVFMQAAVLRDAPKCSADEVVAAMSKIVQVPSGISLLPVWWPPLVTVFIKSHQPHENETLLRSLRELGPLWMDAAWVQHLLDHHSKVGQLDRFLDWLRFCMESGFRFDTESASYLGRLLAERWSLPSCTVRQTMEKIRPFVIGDRQTKQVAQEPGSNAQVGAIEHEVFKQMTENCQRKYWAVTITLYDKYISTDAPFSSRCLELAITACLERDGPSSEHAKAFVKHSQSQGHDATHESRRLLMAEFEQGSAPGQALVRAHDQGLDISSEMFNMIARECIDRHQMQDALDVCDRWVAKHGAGHLGFDEYNFATLIRLYVLLGTRTAHAALEQLVSDFIAHPRWWHRSNTCKNTIKYHLKLLIQGRPRGDLSVQLETARALEAALNHVAERRALSGNPDWIARQVVDIICSDSQIQTNVPETKVERRDEHEAILRDGRDSDIPEHDLESLQLAASSDDANAVALAKLDVGTEDIDEPAKPLATPEKLVVDAPSERPAAKSPGIHLNHGPVSAVRPKTARYRTPEAKSWWSHDGSDTTKDARVVWETVPSAA